MVAAKQADLDLAQFLDVVNHSSGVNFATLNRFPKIIEGDYLEGGLTSSADGQGRTALPRVPCSRSRFTSFTGPACLGVFDLAAALGYGDQISNRVVDAIGDVAGGVRVQQSPEGRVVRIAKAGRHRQAHRGARADVHRAESGPIPCSRARTRSWSTTCSSSPGARTHWHTHEVAQVLHVLAGEGRVQSRDGTGETLQAGDTVHIPAGEEHWHGAAPHSFVLHLAVSVGATAWLDPVSDADYASATQPG